MKSLQHAGPRLVFKQDQFNAFLSTAVAGIRLSSPGCQSIQSTPERYYCCKKGLTPEHAHGRSSTFRLCRQKAPTTPGTRASPCQVHEKWMGWICFLQTPCECGNGTADGVSQERSNIVCQESMLPGELVVGSRKEPNSPAAFTNPQDSEI